MSGVIVLWHTLTVRILESEDELGASVSLGSGLPIPRDCFGIVLGHTWVAVIIYAAELELGIDVSLGGRSPIPFDRLSIVRRHVRLGWIYNGLYQ